MRKLDAQRFEKIPKTGVLNSPDVYFEGLGRGEGGGAVTTVQFIRVVCLTNQGRS